MSTSAPPGGSLSHQRVQSAGFFRDGANPINLTILPPMPPNGLRHPLHRGGPGKYLNRLCRMRSGLCPSISILRHCSWASVSFVMDTLSQSLNRNFYFQL